MRIKPSVFSRRRKKKIKKSAKGYRGARSRWYKLAKESVIRALVYAYRDRKQRKRDLRKLWILRINAFVKQRGLSYSKFIAGLKAANIDVNRKMLADLAISDKEALCRLVDISKRALCRSLPENC